MKKLFIIFSLLLSTNCLAEFRCPSALTGAVIDTITTQVALNQGNTELNPIGVNATIILKGFYFLTVRNSVTEQEKTTLDRYTSAAWTGAGVNNFLVIYI